MITQLQLKELLSYDSITGVFTWKERTADMFSHCKFPDRTCNSWNSKNSGNAAGYIKNDCRTSYVRISLSPCGVNNKRESYYAHVLALIYMNCYDESYDIDHKDGNGLNNSFSNLLSVSHIENCKKRRKSKKNKSGFNGVCWYKTGMKWRVQIGVNGKIISGGYYFNLDDAISKRKQMNVEYGFHINHGIVK